MMIGPIAIGVEPVALTAVIATVGVLFCLIGVIWVLHR